MNITLNEKQQEILVALIKDEITKGKNVDELKGLIEQIEEPKTNKSIIERFIETYKYEDDVVVLKNNEYGINILIGGDDYFLHYNEQNNSIIKLNDFMVSYNAIKMAKTEHVNVKRVFKSNKKYDDLFNDFKLNLEKIGITFCSEYDDEYSELYSYLLPTSKCLDVDFINQFSDIISTYKSMFKKELNYLYS